MDPQSILSIAEEVLLLSLGGSDDEAETRAALVAERHPEFAEKYPKLVAVCVSATTSERAENVRCFLPLMVGQMLRIDDGASTFEGASKAVGEALGAHYLPK